MGIAIRIRRIAAAVVLCATAMTLHAAEPTPLRVMFVGNSITYVNNLPAVVSAYARAQPDGPPIETITYVAPGGTLHERWDDGAATAALRDRHVDVLVLQERGAVLGCVQSEVDRASADCRDALAAHRAFAELARTLGTRVLVLETWSTDAQGQSTQHDGATRVAGRIGATVVHAGDALQAQAHATSRAATFPDGVHPSLGGTLVMGAQLYRAITGVAPTPTSLRIDFPLLPARPAVDPHVPLETQLVGLPVQVYLLEHDALAPVLDRASRYH
ncbi:hypothetical protein [Cognatilysobacter terrigena]|uniref:hypothetical protein n=1 Tax=Cognatilysobacter terrigena TaxID=2488749 RepID=UPI00105B93A3|nr:hypothetical protein [Lysobacter terrigena]